MLETVGGELELLLDCCPLDGGLFDALTDLAHRERPGCGQLDEALFLSFELVELLLELSLHVPILGEDVCYRGGDRFSHAVEDVGGQPLVRDHGDDLRFHLVYADVGHRAQPALMRGTDEVLVGAATPGVLAVQQAAGAASITALTTEEQPLQIVEVDDVPGSIALAHVEHALHFQERLLRDERLVSSDIQLALVPDDSGVIRIAQHDREPAGADGLRSVARRRPGHQALCFEEALESCDRVSPGCVLFERPGNQRCSLWVDVDRVHQAAAVVLADVEVAELGSSN
ncbi:hypothetical protein QSV35_12250 [Microbacterium sp. ASV49]|uniref:Uncharacterized protein n=1 Tax=Microbacterium candidum TaxID=3041922 RepID=A0ABT7N069_9MICO|nr:hypothetical protein [Microbacterium sp. ASV49]MDL9980105.1 hypothetical protein [Microbacterium sp. ASV49]